MVDTVDKPAHRLLVERLTESAPRAGLRRPREVKLKPEPGLVSKVPLACFRSELLRGRPIEGTTEAKVGLDSGGEIGMRGAR